MPRQCRPIGRRGDGADQAEPGRRLIQRPVHGQGGDEIVLALVRADPAHEEELRIGSRVGSAGLGVGRSEVADDRSHGDALIAKPGQLVRVEPRVGEGGVGVPGQVTELAAAPSELGGDRRFPVRPHRRRGDVVVVHDERLRPVPQPIGSNGPRRVVQQQGGPRVGAVGQLAQGSRDRGQISQGEAGVDLGVIARLAQQPIDLAGVIPDGVARGEGGHDLDDTADHEGSAARSRQATTA